MDNSKGKLIEKRRENKYLKHSDYFGIMFYRQDVTFLIYNLICLTIINSINY